MTLPPRPGTGSQVLDDLAEVIGQDAVMALGWEFRGQRLYVPKDPAREPRIAEAIGDEATRQFCRIFGGTMVAFPMKVLIEARVRELAAAGVTKTEIARRLSIREARVYAILAAARDDRQMTLL